VRAARSVLHTAFILFGTTVAGAAVPVIGAVILMLGLGTRRGPKARPSARSDLPRPARARLGVFRHPPRRRPPRPRPELQLARHTGEAASPNRENVSHRSPTHPLFAGDDSSRMTLNVLIVDDDLRLFELLSAYFAQNDVVARSAPDGQTALNVLRANPVDAVLLDVMMPGMDGLTVLRKLREYSDVPVIMLTAKGEDTDRVVGLELGADDYMAKPFNPRELLARLRAVLRRSQGTVTRKRLAVGDLSLDLEGRVAEREGRPIVLTGLEFDLLAVLMQRAGRVVPRGDLLELAGRGGVVVSDRTVDVHVSHLRKKLLDDPPRLIRTIRGVGYILAKGSEE
jgi:two-component system, OmpR family, response regulator